MNKINKEILRLALPNILTNVSVPLLSSVDTALMGRLSIEHIGAIGIASMIFNFLYWNFGFLRMGTTGLTAQAYGGSDDKEVYFQLFKSISLGIVLATLIFIFQNPLINIGVKLMQVPTEMIPLVKEYFYIRIYAAPATLSLYVILGWFFGRQNAQIPLLITIFINVINIILSWYLVVVQQMEISGVAIGTVIAQYGGLLLGIIIILNAHFKFIPAAWKKMSWRWDDFREFLGINRDIFIRTFFLSFAFAFFNAQSAMYGTQILAANIIFLQFINWMSYGIDGFAYASESVVGKYKGRQDRDLMKVALQSSLKWGFVVALVFSVVYLFMGSSFYELFSEGSLTGIEREVVLLWVVITPIIGCWSYIWDGVYVGLTASRAMRNSMIIAFAIYLLAHFLLIKWDVHHGMLLALNIFLLARAVIQAGIFKKQGWDIR